MLDYYIVNAFTRTLFSGNPAGVVVLKESLDPQLMQQIAKENNLSETAFILKNGDNYHIQWFTPEKEVDLCGHATLASSYVIHHFLEEEIASIKFQSKSGDLMVSVTETGYILNFPTQVLEPVSDFDHYTELIGEKVEEAYLSPDKEQLVLVLDKQDTVQSYQFDSGKIAALAGHGVTLTAPSDDKECDYVLRYFAPNYGILEDPVTGSAQTRLAPIWSEKLGKNKLTAKQLSEREGILGVELAGDLVKISGQACLYLRGQLNVN